MNALEPTEHANQVSVRLAGVKFKRALVPVDFSVCSLETLRYAKTFADKFGVAVDVLHVVQHGFIQDRLAMPGLGVIRAMSEAARQELINLVGVLWGNEKHAEVKVCDGRRACEAILREACAINADLIIMGTCKRSWLMGLLRRNTLKRVIQNSPCPVMVLRTGMARIGVSSQNEPSFVSQCNFRWPASK